MSETIKQIQASFNPTEDRLLLKLHTGNQKIQAWITRRYLKLLIPALQGQHPKTGKPLFSPKQQALVEMSQQATPSSAAFEAPYEEPEQADMPLGDHPILLAKLTFKDLESDSPELVLEPEVGVGIGLSFKPAMVSALTKIIGQAVQSAEWDLDVNPAMSLPEGTLVH